MKQLQIRCKMSCGAVVEQSWTTFVEQLWSSCGAVVEQLWSSCGAVVEQLWRRVCGPPRLIPWSSTVWTHQRLQTDLKLSVLQGVTHNPQEPLGVLQPFRMPSEEHLVH